MKKVIALLAVCGFAIALVACGKKAEEASTTADSTATVVETPAVDTTAASADSTAVVDSAAVAH
jgi:hypothetical protein